MDPRSELPSARDSSCSCCYTGKLSETNKGIRDAGSTADFRILFEILKFKNLEIWKIWKILEHLEKFRTFGKFEKVFEILKISIFLEHLEKNLKFGKFRKVFRKSRKF